MDRMTREEIEAFFNKFAFLKAYFSERLVSIVLETFLSPASFDVHPKARTVELGIQFPAIVWDRIVLFTKEGSLVAEVGLRPVEVTWWNPLTWWVEDHFTETLREAVERCDATGAERAYYVAFFERSRGRLTLTTPPAGYSVQSWVKQFPAESDAQS